MPYAKTKDGSLVNEVTLGDGYPLSNDLQPLKVGGEASPIEMSTSLPDDSDSGKVKVRGDLETKGNLILNSNIKGNIVPTGYIELSGTASDTENNDKVRIGATTGLGSEILSIYSNSGYLYLGPQNTSFCHFYTDRNNFYFNRPIIVDGGVSASYDEDFVILRDWNDTTYNQLTLGDDTFEIKLDNTSRLNIDSDGNVGIGTTSPAELLHVASETDPTLVLQCPTNNQTNSGTISFRESGTTDQMAIKYNGSTNNLIIDTSSVSNAFVLQRADGNVGIGTASPIAALTVKSNSTSSGNSGFTLMDNSDTNPIVQIGEKSTDGGRLHMYDGGTLKVSLYTDGTDNFINAGKVGIGTDSPDSTLHVKGAGSDNSTTSFEVDDSGGTNLFYVRDDGVVSITHGYLFAQASSGAYFTGSIKARGGVTDDLGDLGLGSGGNVDHMTISSGNVGIGTTSPDSKLHISYSDDSPEGDIDNNFNDVGLQIENTHTDGCASIQLRSNDADGYIFYDKTGSNAGDMHFRTDGMDSLSVLTLKDDGKVGIGTESPTTKLDVEGTVSYKHTAFTTAGPTDNVDVSDTTVLEVDTSGGSVTIGGFTGGVQGQILYVIKTTSDVYTLKLENSEGGGSQDIFSSDNSDISLVRIRGGVTLYCNGTSWFVLNK